MVRTYIFLRSNRRYIYVYLWAFTVSLKSEEFCFISSIDFEPEAEFMILWTGYRPLIDT